MRRWRWDRIVATAALLAGFLLPAWGGTSQPHVGVRSCREDVGICWNALIDGNHRGHYIVGVSDAPPS